MGLDPWPHTGAVLAGGKSRRMGRSKDALPLADGRTMLETVAATLAEVCRLVVVVGDADTKLQQVADLRAGQGPLGGIEALLASGIDTDYLVCPCDVPLVTSSLLGRLTVRTRAAATVFGVEQELRPLPARISADALDAVRTLLDNDQRAVAQLLRSVETETVAIAPADAALLANVNCPEDYEEALGSFFRPEKGA